MSGTCKLKEKISTDEIIGWKGLSQSPVPQKIAYQIRNVLKESLVFLGTWDRFNMKTSSYQYRNSRFPQDGHKDRHICTTEFPIHGKTTSSYWIRAQFGCIGLVQPSGVGRNICGLWLVAWWVGRPSYSGFQSPRLKRARSLARGGPRCAGSVMRTFTRLTWHTHVFGSTDRDLRSGIA